MITEEDPIEVPETPSRRFALLEIEEKDRLASFAREVRAGLTQSPKILPCRYFYDREGSELFEALCALPEYYLTRAEHAILQEHSDAIAARLPEGTALVELGSGSAAKTRLLIGALLRRRLALHYLPIDISSSALRASSKALLREFPGLRITAVAGEYREGLARLEDEVSQARLILWLGSNVGNFDREEAASFLRRVRATMLPADRLLVGIDLRKEGAVLERAYDDARGLTARFNLNILARINRQLGGRFELEAFAHRARYNAPEGRIEMYLLSTRVQHPTIEALDLEVPFARGETIHTENSYKYSPDEISALSRAAGLRLEAQFFDPGRRFSSNLFAPA